MVVQGVPFAILALDEHQAVVVIIKALAVFDFTLPVCIPVIDIMIFLWLQYQLFFAGIDVELVDIGLVVPFFRKSDKDVVWFVGQITDDIIKPSANPFHAPFVLQQHHGVGAILVDREQATGGDLQFSIDTQPIFNGGTKQYPVVVRPVDPVDSDVFFGRHFEYLDELVAFDAHDNKVTIITNHLDKGEMRAIRRDFHGADLPVLGECFDGYKMALVVGCCRGSLYRVLRLHIGQRIAGRQSCRCLCWWCFTLVGNSMGKEKAVYDQGKSDDKEAVRIIHV